MIGDLITIIFSIIVFGLLVLFIYKAHKRGRNRRKKLREQIANSVDDYLFYNCRCPNMHDEIIRRILDEDAKPLHCKTDCDNESCALNQTKLIN